MCSTCGYAASSEVQRLAQAMEVEDLLDDRASLQHSEYSQVQRVECYAAGPVVHRQEFESDSCQISEYRMAILSRMSLYPCSSADGGHVGVESEREWGADP